MNAFIFFMFMSTFSYAQVIMNDYSFDRYDSVKFTIVNDKVLNFSTAGGLNSCQFSSIDLNGDSINDLFVYDRLNKKVSTFINKGIVDSIAYEYAPRYESAFPIINSWVQLIDYNNDGKEDLFTYNAGGISVYKNITNHRDSLKFEQILYHILSYYYTSLINIYVTSADFPAIVDLDNDGDLDILTFGILGGYVEFHKNLSMESDGIPHLNKFTKQESCWGLFAESDFSNSLTLNISCPWKADTLYPKYYTEQYNEDEYNNNYIKRDRHVGSTMLALDIDADDDKDLLLGDIDFFNLVMLTNGGTINNALINSQDSTFPKYNKPIEIPSFPAAFYIDVNNDSIKDLIASPFDGLYFIAENKNSVWLYKNVNTTNAPQFNFVDDGFLQNEMIDVGSKSYPVLFDYNNDGLTDLFIGNFGYWDSSYYHNGFLYANFISKIAQYKNVGTASKPEFKLITDNFCQLDTLKTKGLFPTFANIDSDNDVDLITGNDDGSLIFFENRSNSLDTFIFNTPVFNYQGINIGRNSTPCIVDLNRDGLLDLIIGEKNGTLNFFKNNGTINNPIFNFITDSLGKVSVRNVSISNYGYSTPSIVNTAQNNYHLFVGSESGAVNYYRNIDDNLEGTFERFDNNLLRTYLGARTSVTLKDINNDGFLDAFIGNIAGGISFFKGVTPKPINTNDFESKKLEITLYPNPASKYVIIKHNNNVETCCSFKIYDQMGNICLSNKKQMLTQPINIEILSNGVYYLSLIINNNQNKTVYFGKLIIIK